MGVIRTANIMKKSVIAFISGMIFCLLLTVPVFYFALTGTAEQEKGNGFREGSLFVVKALEKEFGSIPYSDKNFDKVIVSIKTNEIVTINKNGVKTIKITGF